MGNVRKRYLVVCDVSPSEQLSIAGPGEIKAFAALFGLRNSNSVNLVGPDDPVEARRMLLQKWSRSKQPYKNRFIEVALAIGDDPSPHVIPGGYVADDVVIGKVGLVIVERLLGKLPKPSSFSKTGRPRLTVRGPTGSGISNWELLRDDVLVLGWYAENLANMVKSLSEINGEPVQLDIIIDRLPLDHDDRRAHLLRFLVENATSGLGKVVGRPAASDTAPRDLFVDNLAGLLREVATGVWNGSSEDAKRVFRMTRELRASDLPKP